MNSEMSYCILTKKYSFIRITKKKNGYRTDITRVETQKFMKCILTSLRKDKAIKFYSRFVFFGTFEVVIVP